MAQIWRLEAWGVHDVKGGKQKTSEHRGLLDTQI